MNAEIERLFKTQIPKGKCELHSYLPIQNNCLLVMYNALYMGIVHDT